MFKAPCYLGVVLEVISMLDMDTIFSLYLSKYSVLLSHKQIEKSPFTIHFSKYSFPLRINLIYIYINILGLADML